MENSPPRIYRVTLHTLMMIALFSLAVGVLAGRFSKRAVYEAPLMRITPGMTIDEVRAIAGEPIEIGTYHGATTWSYDQGAGVVTLIFKDGVILDYSTP